MVQNSVVHTHHQIKLDERFLHDLSSCCFSSSWYDNLVDRGLQVGVEDMELSLHLLCLEFAAYVPTDK